MQTKRDLTAHGAWLTDPTVPSARPVWATKQARFGRVFKKAWVPEEDTMWADFRTGIIYIAVDGRITDFSSIPFGVGGEGPLRGAGRLHDLMGGRTPVLYPNNDDSLSNLMELLGNHAPDVNHFVTYSDVIKCGYRRGILPVGIPEAGRLYRRMLTSAGYSRTLADIYVAGLVTFQLQKAYRWLYYDTGLKYHSERDGNSEDPRRASKHRRSENRLR